MSKYSLIISDDDEILLKGLLSFIPWDAMNIEVVAHATNGLEALKYVKEFHPTMLLTDIKMPFMNGVELMQKVKEVSPLTIIVVMSAYDDFSYTKSAIQNGASDYILKPIDIEKFSSVLTGLLKDAQEQSQLAEKLNTLHMIENKLDTKETIEMFEALLFRKYDQLYMNAHFADLLQHFQYENYQVLLIRETLSDTEYAHIATMIQEYFALQCTGIVEFKNMYLVIYSHEDTLDDIRKKLKELIQLNCNLRVSFSCGTIVHQLVALFDSTNEAKIMKELWYDECVGEDLDLTHKTILKENVSRNKRITCSLADKIFETLMKGDIDLLNEYVNRYEETLKACGASASNILIFHVNSIFYRITNEFDRMNMNVKELCKTEGDVSSVILKQETFKDRLALFEKYILQIATYYQEKLIGSHEEAVRKSCTFIDQNFCQSDLSLRDVAEYVHMSKNYFCTLFSKIMGKTYSEYLTEQRIKEAQRLLMDTSLKNYEIANKVGFENPTYFSFAFKKLLGVTPSQYVKMIKE